MARIDRVLCDGSEPAAMRRLAGRAVAPVVALATLAAFARPAAAHGGLAGEYDAPVPLPLVYAGGAAAVAATALLLVRLRDVPAVERRLLVVPARVARPVVAAARVGVALALAAALVAGVLGPRNYVLNPASLLVWPVWFNGLGLVAVVFGNPWRALAPWRLVHDALSRLEGEPIRLRPYPDRLGRWPALLGFLLLLGVVENLTLVPRLPAATAGVVAVYALAMLAGGVALGPRFFDRADPLSVLYDLLGRVAPLPVSRRADGALVVSARVPWRGLADPVPDRASAAFVVAAVYTVSFDGFVESPAYRAVYFGTREALGVGAVASVPLYLLGLAGFLAAFAAAVALAAGATDAGGRRGRGRGNRPHRPARGDGAGRSTAASSTVDAARGSPVARAFAATLVPVAAGYELAHDWGYVAAALSRLPGAVAGTGARADLLAPLPPGLFWTSQVALVVAGHVVAVVAAHRAATALVDDPARAPRVHAPVAALAVAYTVVSLWVVSLPVS